jgi:hypothetical protein
MSTIIIRGRSYCPVGKERQRGASQFTVSVETPKGTERITCWEGTTGSTGMARLRGTAK